ncbi:hypothetical protein NW768_003358 [Fusarium equiseti]|uniref:Uncharacterized protein n=1 Tax=Fusarium equiseti TaxID=61235 RepID=A0ABQ8RLN6_FUSEQ|nr:hypothetical protein NW768_003358 [Fusarium equiseti]
MDQPGDKLEPEPAPLTKLESPDHNSLVSSPDQRTHLAGSEQCSDSICVATESSYPSVDVVPEDYTIDEVHPRSAQPYNGSGVDIKLWTVEDLVNLHHSSQEDFMAEYRSSAAQNNSQLVRAVQGEVQSGMNQVIDFIKHMIGQPTQPSTQTDIESLKSQLKSEKLHSKDLQSNYNISIHTIEQQQKEIHKANSKLQDALQERDQLRKLLSGGSLANSSKVTDDAIKSKWTEIDYNIRCLVCILDDAPPAQMLDVEVTRRLRFVFRHYGKLLHNPELREFLMRAYFWVLIQDNVFNSGEPLWGGPDLRSYKVTRASLIDRIGEIEGRSERKPTIADTARWLAQGSTIMAEVWDDDANAIKHMIHTETKRLRPFASDRQFRTDRTDRKISDQLRDIIDSSIELDKMMMFSKAIFMIEWCDTSQNPGSSQRWNPEAMEAEAYGQDLSQKSRVKLRLSPILHKFGTADGQNYDSSMILAKGKVVCD